MSFKTLYDAGNVKRFHTRLTLREQTIATHQWGVAMILLEIAPDNIEVIRAALVHDLGESISGDIPYTAKRTYPDLRRGSELAEANFFQIHNFTDEPLSEEDGKLLDWADMYECLLFAKQEVAMGNQTMQQVVTNSDNALREMGHPNEAARKLYEELWNGNKAPTTG